MKKFFNAAMLLLCLSMVTVSCDGNGGSKSSQNNNSTESTYKSYSFLNGRWKTGNLPTKTYLGIEMQGNNNGSGRFVMYEKVALYHDLVWSDEGDYETEDNTIYLYHDDGQTDALTIVSMSEITDGTYSLTKQ